MIGEMEDNMIEGTIEETVEEPVQGILIEGFLDEGAAEARVAVDQPAVEEPVEVVEISTVSKTFQAWLVKSIHNSPLSRHTDSYNYLLSQLPELEAMLNEENKS